MSEFAGKNVTIGVIVGFAQDGRPVYEHSTGKLRKYDSNEGAYLI